MTTTPYIGSHGMFVLRNVPHALLEKVADVKPRLWNIANRAKLTVVAECGHQFQPIGATYILVLAESHMSIHTYPEHQTAYMDIFCCNPSFDMDGVIDIIAEEFNIHAKDIEWSSVKR